MTDWEAVVAALVDALPPTADATRAEREIRRAIDAGLWVTGDDGMTEIPVLPGWSMHVRLSAFPVR
jgi:hypothetical protein